MFGDFLAELLEARDRPVRALATELEIGVSLVYKWLRGSRTPSRHSAYVEKIAKALALAPGEHAALRDAQIRSLHARPASESVPKRVAALVARIVDHRPAQGAAEAAPEQSAEPLAQRWPDGAIRTRQNMYEAALDLICDVAMSTPKTGDALLFTFQSDVTEEFDPTILIRWRQAVRDALRRGWQVEHIWRLNRDARRTVGLVAYMLDLLGAGRYMPLYIGGDETLMPPYDLVILPDTAFLLLATQSQRDVDAGILTRDADQIALYKAHFSQLHARAKPLLRSYTPQESVQLSSAIVRAEDELSGRVFVKYGLSLYTEPEAWSRPDAHWIELVRREGLPIEPFIENRGRRLENFKQSVRTHLYRDICPMAAIECMVRDRIYLVDGNHRPPISMTAEAIREHLSNTIRVLKEHDNYLLGLVDEEDDVPVSMHMLWEVLGGKRATVCAMTLDEDNATVPRDVVITEPTIASACQQYFEILWGRISPRNRDKGYVIWWLERQLERLHGSLEG